MNLWSMRSMIPILCLLQFHIIRPSPYSIIRRWSVSGCPHFEQAPESVSRKAAKRSFVGMMSCITAYHHDFVVSWTRWHVGFPYAFQSTPGNMRTIRSSPGVLALLISLSCTSYTLRFNFCRFSPG